MILVEEAIQRVQSLYSKGVPSKDSRLTERHIYSCLMTARATVLEQKANKGQYLSEWDYGTLSCVKLVLAPIHDCPCAPDGFTMLRSKEALPRPLVSNEKPIIYSVSTIDNTIYFDRKEYSTYKYTSGRRYTFDKPFYMIKGGYIYLGYTKKIEAIFIIGAFLDPYEMYLYPTACDECNNCKCKSPFELEFPIDGRLLDAVIKIASEEAIILFNQMKQDIENNATDDNNDNGTMVHQPQQPQQQNDY